MLVEPGPAGSSLLPLAVGGAIAGAVDRAWGLRPRLKWPNDLVVPGAPGPTRKLGGILVDGVEGPRATRIAVVGVGLNVRTPSGGWATTRPIPAVGVDELLPAGPSVDEVEVVVAAAIEEAAADLGTPDGRRAAIDRCGRLLYGVGRSALVDGRLAGTIRGIAPDGALELDRDGEPMTIRAGDLTVLDP